MTVIFHPSELSKIENGRGQKTMVLDVPLRGPQYDATWSPNVYKPHGAYGWTWWDGPSHGQSMYHSMRLPKVGDFIDQDGYLIEITSIEVTRIQEVHLDTILNEMPIPKNVQQLNCYGPSCAPSCNALGCYGNRQMFSDHVGADWENNSWIAILGVEFKLNVPLYVNLYGSGVGRGEDDLSKMMHQFAINNAEAIEKEFAKRVM